MAIFSSRTPFMNTSRFTSWVTAAIHGEQGGGTLMRSLVAMAAASLLVVGVSAATEADAAIKRFTNIEAQGLEPALKTLARERALQLVYRSEVVGAMTTAGVSGEMTADEALRSLLVGTGLTYQYLDETTVTIVPVATSPAQKNPAQKSEAKSKPIAATPEKTGFWSRMRLAQAERTSTSAASDSTEGGPLQEITVTAQKREESAHEVPISISVLSGEDLDRSTAEGVTESLNRVPGVATSVSLQGGGTRIAVRGVTSGGSLFGGSTPVSYYLDSVPFALVKTPIGPDSSAYDLDRVEVLRGPQGTLYGASALNGVVRVLTKDADLDELQFKARTSASGTKDGGENYRGDVAVNVPLIEGKLAARAVLGYQDSSGWIDQPIDNDANDSEIGTARLKLNAQPTDQLSIGLSAWLSRSDYGAPPAGDDDARNPSLADLSMSTDYDAFGLKIGYDFAPFTISSQTSYLDYSNAGNVDVTPGTPVASSVIVFTGIDASVFSQEILLNSTGEGPWQWSIGTSYRDADDRLRQTIAPAGTRFDWTNDSKSYAAFGEVSQRFFADRLRWTAGLRYFHDDVGLDENFVPPGQVLAVERSFVSCGDPPRGADLVSERRHHGLQLLLRRFPQRLRSESDRHPASDFLSGRRANFIDTSTAGTASITAADGFLGFFNTSTAGDATINLLAGRRRGFTGASRAGTRLSTSTKGL